MYDGEIRGAPFDPPVTFAFLGSLAFSALLDFSNGFSPRYLMAPLFSRAYSVIMSKVFFRDKIKNLNFSLRYSAASKLN